MSRNGLLRAAVLGLAFFGGIYAARAKPGGPTKDALTYAGTLKQNGQPMSGMHTFSFTLVKAGATCTPPDQVVDVDTSGGFVTQIPTATCPGFFDGADVTVDVKVDGSTLVSAAPLNAVPYAKFADTAGSPDCPATYVRDPSAANIMLCRNGKDEIVKVGSGAAAFWIDRYEASVWSGPAGIGTQFGATTNDYPGTFPANGQVLQKADLLYAASVDGVQPSANLTWFQMEVACMASGKRLPTNAEWQIAAMGTNDPGASNGANGTCFTQGAGKRATGAAGADANCSSLWGAQDMIGNLGEATAEWYAGLPSASPGAGSHWPNASYGTDVLFNVSNYAIDYPNGTVVGLPTVGLRGGFYGNGTDAGMFYLALNVTPSSWVQFVGFRCVVSR